MNSFHGPLSVAPIISRISAQVPGLLTVGGAMEYALAQKRPTSECPAAYVIRASEVGNSQTSGTQIKIEDVQHRVSVCLAFVPRADRDFALQNADMDAIETAVRKALLEGWTYPELPEPAPQHKARSMRFISSQVTTTDQQSIWVSCIFQLTYTQRYI